jgi:hypothetical protein
VFTSGYSGNKPITQDITNLPKSELNV